jgi:preprotein translocase SecE subunit
VANKMAEKKKSPGRSQTAELKTRGKEKEQPAKSARVATREVRKEQKTESKAAPRREKGSPIVARIRSNRIGRFFLEAYYELRHKVTWPTFEQARNMTIAVIVISVLIGALLAAADFGLYHLFLLIIGGGK